ncbi:MAG: glycosyltransferase family 4 protein [Desulfobacterales bacterium]|nr:MAG: glycosyltransferase family 4 protein [Desulfobacterales bacterium]
MKRIHIGFISTRFAGIDGVSLEANKWAEIFQQSGHKCYWFAGQLDRQPKRSLLVPEAHFQHPKNQWINEQIFGKKGRTNTVTELIHTLRSLLKIQLYQFIDRFNIDLLIAENVLTIPLNIPLGLSLAETIAETEMPTIAHHHDFYWERERFALNAVNDYLRMAFPPKLPNIKHVVIHSDAQEQLALRTGISSIIVPNVLDFENPPEVNAQGAAAFRKSIDLKPEDKMILQPTRIIRRKGIEQAIALVKELKDPRYKLVISHESGDEGHEYTEWLIDYALENGVDLRMVNTQVADPWNGNGSYRSKYTLWNIYPHADFITYPSFYEGFGNALIEAVYFKKPLLINRYPTFARDIEPKGFDLVVMDGYLSKSTVYRVKEILESPELREKMVNTNYEVASHHYSYAVLRNQLTTIMNELFDGPEEHLSESSLDSQNIIHLTSKKDRSPAQQNIS